MIERILPCRSRLQKQEQEEEDVVSRNPQPPIPLTSATEVVKTAHGENAERRQTGKSNDSLWFIGEVKDAANDYDGPGMNHIAFATETQAEVDQAVSHLRANGIATLFETPRHRPEFAGSEGETYYQVMFESPDRILVEIVYTGAKSA